jgi:hypothetical protein
MVEVFFPNNVTDIPELGVFGQYMRAVVNNATFPNKLDWRYSETSGAREGLLDSSWITSTSRSIDTRRGGKYAQIGGAELKFLAAANIPKTLSLHGLSLYGKTVTVRYLNASTGLEGVYYKGIVTKVDENIETTDVSIESITKNYKSTLSKLIEGTSNYYPVNFGQLDNARLVEGKYDETPVNYASGITAILKPFQLFSAKDRIEVRIETTDLNDSQDIVDAIKILINSGEDVYLKGVFNRGKGQYFKIKSYFGTSFDGTYRYSILNLVSVMPDIDDKGVTFIGEVDPETENPLPVSSLVFVGTDSKVYSDLFGEFDLGSGNPKIRTFVNNRFSPAPEYGSSVNFNSNSISVASEGENVNVLSGFYRVDLPDFEPSTDIVPSLASFTDKGIEESWAFQTNVKNTLDEDTGVWINAESPYVGVLSQEVIIPETPRYDTLLQRDSGAGVLDGVGIVVKFPEIGDIGGADTFYLCSRNNLTMLSITINISIGASMIGVYGDEVLGFLQDEKLFDPASSSWVLRNAYPLMDLGGSLETRDVDFWRQDRDGEDENDFRLGFGYSALDVTTIKEMPEYGGRNLVVWMTTNVEDGGAKPISSSLTLDRFAVLGYFDGIELDNIFTEWTGRVSTAHGAYEHVLRLQNYRSTGYEKPVNGWGLEIPVYLQSAWDAVYDSSTDYGGINNPDLTGINIKNQLLNQSEIASEKIKADLLRHMWAMGTISRSGVEKVYPLIEALNNTDGVLLDYHDTIQDPKVTPIKYDDVFCEVNVGYQWNTGSNANSSFITVTNVEQDTFLSSYVTGVSDIEKAEQIWKMGHALFIAYGVKNTYPESNGNLRWIDNEDNAVDWIIKAYQWQGVVFDEIEGEAIVKKRYELNFTMADADALLSGVEHGQKIRVNIPYIVEDELEPHSGIITTISGAPRATTAGKVKIVAQMLSTEIQGTGISYIIDESLDSHDTEYDEEVTPHDEEIDEGKEI